MSHITSWSWSPRGRERLQAKLRTDLKDIHDLSRAVFFCLLPEGKALVEMNVKKANLEEIFLELTGQDRRGAGSPAHGGAGGAAACPGLSGESGADAGEDAEEEKQ